MQVGQPKGAILADIGKEIQLIWSGAATSSKLLAENRGLAERFLTGAIKGREYARRFKDQTIAVVSKYDKSPREGIELDYDATVSSMTAEGSVTDDVLKDEIATRADAQNGFERLLVSGSAPPSRIVEALPPRLEQERSQRRPGLGRHEAIERDQPVAALGRDSLLRDPIRRAGSPPTTDLRDR